MTTQMTTVEKDVMAITFAFFAANVRNLLSEPSRLDALAALAGVPPDRVPAVREALTRANSAGLAS